MHFACAVICRQTREGMEALVLDSISTDPRTGRKSEVQIKFPGGMQKGSEEPFNTMRREVLEETGLKVERGREVYKAPSPSDPKLIQFGYLVEIDDCSGRLRDQKPIVDGDTVLSQLRWVDLRVIRRGGLFPTHHGVFLAALRDLYL